MLQDKPPSENGRLHALGVLAAAASLCVAAVVLGSDAAADAFPRPAIPVEPRHYVCYRTASAPTIDGRLDDAPWMSVSWTEQFVDILGDGAAAPRFATRAKMLWDKRCLYIGAELTEPDVWATLTTRDAVIYHDNDFEIFIDPDGDNHDYYELEINALGTEWDLFLTRPYRDDGDAVNEWDIGGLETGVAVDGTINVPGDLDRGWTAEIAIPWEALAPEAGRPAPPVGGDTWRINFSRVEWKTRIQDGEYVKLTDPDTGRPLPEDNWVWSPQGLVAMHYPEMWGYVQFTEVEAGEGPVSFVADPTLQARAALMEIYYDERGYRAAHGVYTSDPSALGLEDRRPSARQISEARFSWPPEIRATDDTFEASVVTDGGDELHVSHQGRLWQSTDGR
jgi:hypothetical protein